MAAAGAWSQAPHGKKRAAETALENEQRLSKRLDLLHLDGNNGARYYLPVPASTDVASQPTRQLPRPLEPVSAVKKREKKQRTPPIDDDYMQVEDTPHRVFIRDLSAELSETESDEDRPIFLPDIEKHIAKIPHHLLAGPELKPTQDNQLILYNVPSSLTLPEEQDRVRKAIMEARERMREKQALQANSVQQPVYMNNPNGITNRMTPAADEEVMSVDDDADAMDID